MKQLSLVRSAVGWAFILVAVVGMSATLFSQTPQQDWENFRKEFPFHIQTIALSDIHPDGNRTLIISEPPPHTTLQSIKNVSPQLFKNAMIKRHAMGYDGLVKDVVIQIPDSEDILPGLIANLSFHLFHTRYKAHAIMLPYQKGDFQVNLDLQVGSEEIESWLQDPQSTFGAQVENRVYKLDDIRNSNETAVFFGNQPGILLWWIPKTADLKANGAVLRQFALDSDLILGAQILENGVLIVARERVVDFEILPPLRSETIELLATTDNANLAQSYERTHIFAGRYDNDNDWAPIYLSSELRNTEYGSLLNITDQLLKSWSNNGLTRYVNFKYPDPPKWPFNASLPRYLTANTVTYNWNTRGAGYSTTTENSEIYALYRTAVLPVNYFPDLGEDDPSVKSKFYSAEDTAYKYFAGLSDPNLVRVVQYAALYQIFQRAKFFVKAGYKPPPQPELELNKFAEAVFSEIESMGYLERSKISRQLAKEQFEVLKNSQLNSLLFREGLTEANLYQFYREILDDLKSELSNTSAKGRAFVIRFLLRDRELAKADTALLRRFINRHQDLIRYAELIVKPYAKIKGVYQQYAQKSIDNAEINWIRTAVVVQSTSIGEMANFVGGHNLDAKIPRFLADATVRRGRHKVEEIDGVFHIKMHPEDMAKVRHLVRDVGRNSTDIASLKSVLNRRLPRVEKMPARPLHRAIGIEGQPIASRLNRGASFAEKDARMYSAWKKVDRPVEPKIRELFSAEAAHNVNTIVVKEGKDKSFTIVNHLMEQRKVYKHEDIADVVVGLLETNPGSRQSLNIHFEGFSNAEASAQILGNVRLSARKSGIHTRFTGNRSSASFQFSEYRRILSQADFSKSKVSSKNLPDRSGFEVFVEVPHKNTGKISQFISRVKVLTKINRKKLFLLRVRIEDKIRRFLKKPLKTEFEKQRILDDLNLEIRTIERQNPNLKIDNIFDSEAGVLRFVIIQKTEKFKANKAA